MSNCVIVNIYVARPKQYHRLLLLHSLSLSLSSLSLPLPPSLSPSLSPSLPSLSPRPSLSLSLPPSLSPSLSLPPLTPPPCLSISPPLSPPLSLSLSPPPFPLSLSPSPSSFLSPSLSFSLSLSLSLPLSLSISLYLSLSLSPGHSHACCAHTRTCARWQRWRWNWCSLCVAATWLTYHRYAPTLLTAASSERTVFELFLCQSWVRRWTTQLKLYKSPVHCGRTEDCVVHVQQFVSRVINTGHRFVAHKHLHAWTYRGQVELHDFVCTEAYSVCCQGFQQEENYSSLTEREWEKQLVCWQHHLTGRSRFFQFGATDRTTDKTTVQHVCCLHLRLSHSLVMSFQNGTCNLFAFFQRTTPQPLNPHPTSLFLSFLALLP